MKDLELLEFYFKDTGIDSLKFDLGNYFPETFIAIDKDLTIHYYYEALGSQPLKKNFKDFSKPYKDKIITKIINIIESNQVDL